MTALGNRKRKQNVRSSSSCSSGGFNEYGMETECMSENSISDVDLANRFRRNEEKTGSRKRAKCTSKNAINARMNRERKKEHLNGLLERADKLSKENSQLKYEKKRDRGVIEKLKEEVNYFKSVLANRRELSTLLKCVRQSSTLPLSSLNARSNTELQFDPSELIPVETMNRVCDDFDPDLFQTCVAGLSDDPLLSSCALQQLSDDDLIEQNIADMSEEVNGKSPSVGVCLHVSQRHVSIEFCPVCNNNAAALWEENTG